MSNKSLGRNLEDRLRDLLGIRKKHWTERAFGALVQWQEKPDSFADGTPENFLFYSFMHAEESHSQLFQDLFVRWKTKDKREGFFVEFGATDGVTLSNTKSLEERLGWRGILAEPARCWHENLRRNRSAVIETRCVWTSSGQTLNFSEVAEAELSTLQTFSERDVHAASRKDAKTYPVETISLEDLLSLHKAPRTIDYMSVDTEGSELAILSAFDFSKYDIRVLTVEHNHTPDREKIHALLTSKGYVRTFEQLSQWDDWYVKA